METIVMTGVTRGIGKEAVQRLVTATPDLTLVLLAREKSDLSWLDDVVGERTTVHVVGLDLDSMAGAARSAARVADLVEGGVIPPPTALVLNAGVQHVTASEVSGDGLEATFAVNVVANHVLVQRLAPLVQEGGRIIITVSDTHFGDLRHNLGMVPGPVWLEPRLLAQPGSLPDADSSAAGRTAYSTSKLAAIYQVHEYARRYPGLVVLAFNPGFVPATGLARHANSASRFAMDHLLPLLARTPIASTSESAGRDLAYLAVAGSSLSTGSYVDRRQVVPSSQESYDQARETALVAYLDELTAS